MRAPPPDTPEQAENALERGRQVIASFARQLPLSPGVYRMLDKKGDPLYIGKAKHLQKRVVSYTRIDALPRRLQRMVMETVAMEAIHTRSEAEALILEANMIRKYLPRYNVLLRDDKSVPYIFISGDHPFPLLQSHRGPKSRKGDYYGPFASTDPVRKTINILQRVFLLRNCSDTMFAQRDRPCMQYHIKRCTAPCVGRVGVDDYAEQVRGAKDFLEGRSAAIQQMLAEKMQQASAAQDYELAAVYRDRIRALSDIQAQQDLSTEALVDDVDVIAGYQQAGQSCVQVFFFRKGRNYGSKAYFPRHAADVDLAEVMTSFIGQFYQTRPCAPEILLSHELPEKPVLEEALSQENSRRVTVHYPQRGPRRQLVLRAVENARQALARVLADTDRHREMLEKLGDLAGLAAAPERVEIYDNSHLGGTNALGVMVVTGPDGFEKKHYRKFNIRQEDAAGDDYAMMREVLLRRLSPLADREKTGDEAAGDDGPVIPDLLVIDGGKGQLSAARDILEQLGLAIPVIAIAKGRDRNAGREWLHFEDREPVQLPPSDPLLYFLQRIRDEAHRFAITGQRARRNRAMLQSALDGIKGIGAKRKKALLLHFGSAKAVEGATIQELMRVEGISRAMAEQIYGHFNGGATG